MKIQKQMKRKKLFFLLYSMNVGGVEKSLLGLLSLLPQEEYELHVGLVHPEGAFLPLLPAGTTVHTIPALAEHWAELNDPPLLTVKAWLRQGRVVSALCFLFAYLYGKLRGTRYWMFRYLFRHATPIAGHYDLAVAYAGPAADLDYYVCRLVDARRKAVWIHFDVDQVGIDAPLMRRLYRLYDRIYVVSQQGAQIFGNRFPGLKSKVRVFHNVVSADQVRAQAAVGPTFTDDFRGRRVLTVGRVSSEKGQAEAVQALRRLVDVGHDVRWYFVGDGPDRVHCEALAAELGVADRTIFLGTQTNPYAFMRDCDVYVQPSHYEGYCITLHEVRCFQVPIVATRFTGSEEQLSHRANGVIVGMSPDEIARGVEQALTLPEVAGVAHFQNDISLFTEMMG